MQIAASPPATGDPGRLAGLLSSHVPRQRRSSFYFLGTALVAGAMVILPLLYLALLAAVAWLIAMHAVHGLVLFEHNVGRVSLMLYAGPLIVGVISWLFLIKPLFTHRKARGDYVVLDRGSEPVIHAYVERLAHVLGAPVPREIRIDSNVNASAGFRRGVVSFLGNDLVLTIGSPLLAGMSLRQLTGVMAHELGHFAQGGAMRVSYVIRSINWWFARVVHERDRFDDGLEDGLKSKSVFWIGVCTVAKGMVALSRAILGLLMNLGVLISSFQLRQMEFDADRCEVLVSGSAEFAVTARRLQELAIGNSIVGRDMSHFAVRGVFPVAPGELAVAEAARVEKKAIDEHWQQVLAARTERMATHPCDADRIAHAEALASPGLLTDPAPAAALLLDAACVQQAVGVALYAAVLPVPPDPEKMVPVARFMAQKDHAVAVNRSLARYAPTGFDTTYMQLPSTETIGAVSAADARSRLAAVHADIQLTLQRRQDIPPSTMSERLALGLRLAMEPGSPGATNDKATAAGPPADALLGDWSRLQPLLEPILAISNRLGELMNLVRLHNGELTAEAAKTALEHSHAIVRRLSELNPLVATAHLACETTAAILQQASVANLPAAERIGDVLNCGSNAARLVFSAQADLVAELVYLADQAETAMGLAPLVTAEAEGGGNAASPAAEREGAA